MRNYDLEAQNNIGRDYQYNYDAIARQHFMDKVSPFIRTGIDAKSLEVGSFDGSMTDLLLKYLNNLSIVEPSEKMAAHVRSRFGEQVEIFLSTIENFKTENKYENIFLVHTLEHIDNPVEALISLRNLLTHEGRLFVMVPNANAISRQIAAQMGFMRNPRDVIESESLQGHVRTYDYHSLRSDIVNSQLKIEHSGGVILKALANFQMDAGLSSGIISKEYLAAADVVGNQYPDLCGSLFFICSR